MIVGQYPLVHMTSFRISENSNSTSGLALGESRFLNYISLANEFVNIVVLGANIVVRRYFKHIITIGRHVL